MMTCDSRRGIKVTNNWRFCLFVTHRTSSFSTSTLANITYDELRGDNHMDISTGIFSAPCSGVFEFMFQGINVSVFPFFPF